ncbi:hypothetical protein [Alicyclobacillus sp. ALC3]|uniref:hypothetical protein n=1 Tax=Alicyclobacillus sp. ALC3 TaxID=2796143 RepID=UPI002379E478|nr:hypothetical protein [Alicyclobacillus sp. ALC3]WDL97173.1 hypothetical protein JC200_23435 [Alicyclobacillus sp. ALC3]
MTETIKRKHARIKLTIFTSNKIIMDIIGHKGEKHYFNRSVERRDEDGIKRLMIERDDAMKRSLLLAGFLLILFSVAGCGTDSASKGARTTPAYAYEVVWAGRYYAIGKQINAVGSEIGTVKHFEQNSKSIQNNGSNFFPVGTTLFSIPGANVNNVIAGEYKGRYFECNVLN